MSLGSRASARDADALSLPSREFVGKSRAHGGFEPDARQKFVDACVAALRHAPRAKRLADRVADALTGTEAGEGILKHHLRGAYGRPERLAAQTVDGLPGENHLAGA